MSRSCYVAHKNADEVCLHAGIEGVDATGSVPLSWMQFSNSNIKVSKGIIKFTYKGMLFTYFLFLYQISQLKNIYLFDSGIREKSEELRGDIDSLINDSAKDLLHHWNNTNRLFNFIL